MKDLKIVVLKLKEGETGTDLTLAELLQRAEEVSLEELIAEANNSEKKNNTEEKYGSDVVGTVLRELGVPMALKGYRYLKHAIETYDPDTSLTKELYPTVAREFSTTSSRVERAIRHAVEVAWTRGNEQTFRKIFGYSCDPCKGKATNGEFIAAIYEYLS